MYRMRRADLQMVGALCFLDTKCYTRFMMTAQQKRKLITLFKKGPITVAYLFGSLALGKERKESDADIAINIVPSLSKEHRFALRLKLMGQLSRILQRNVDVVVLNDVVSPFFKYIIIKEGVLLYQKSALDQFEIENTIYNLYFDFQPFLTQYNNAYVARHH